MEETEKFIKLPKEFKTKWIKELRDGKHEQTICSMYRSNTYTLAGQERPKGFCCLGIAGLVCGIPKTDMLDKGAFSDFNKSTLDKYNIPLALRGDVNLSANNPGSPTPELIKLNDMQKKSFSEIADWIEKNL